MPVAKIFLILQAIYASSFTTWQSVLFCSIGLVVLIVVCLDSH